MAHIKNSSLIVEHANTFWLRLIGLMFRNMLERNHVMVIEPCHSVHTFFMRYSLDLLILNKKGEIIGLIKDMKPGRVSSVYKGAVAFIECNVGTIDTFGFQIGQIIEIIH